MKTVIGLASVSLAVIMTGCGGGGPSTPPQTTTGTTPPVDESSANPALALIGAAAAYEAGFTGQGIKIALIDTGVQASHSTFDGKFDKDHVIESILIGTHTDNPYIIYNDAQGWLMTPTIIKGDQVAGVSYQLTNANQVYSTEPTITISGDGTGATARAMIDSQGHMIGIVMTNAGTGYTNASVTISDPSGNITNTKIHLAGQDNDGHGTFVASQVASAKDGVGIQGVAYDAELFAIKATLSPDTRMMDNGKVLDTVEWARQQGVQIINQSFGTLGIDMAQQYNIDNYRTALQANISIVSAAGNDGANCLTIDQCAKPAALPWESSMGDLLTKNGAWIVVGALNESGTDIASFSNRAGITKSNYILAPGSGNMGAGLDGGLAPGYGTSYAAPIVSGAMALMYQKWPQLTGRQIADIMFKTTDDMGAAGVDDIYGNGKLNLQKAFSPVGDLLVPSGAISVSNTTLNPASVGGTGMLVSLANTQMRVGTSMGLALQSFEPLNNTIALDSFNRDFQMNMTAAIAPTIADVSGNDYMDFDNFMKFNLGKFAVGVDSYRNSAALGWNFDKTMRMMVSQAKDLFGTTGTGLLGLGNPNTYYLNLEKTFRNDDLLMSVQGTVGYGSAEHVRGSMISSVSSTVGYGAKAKISYNGLGLSYEVPMHIEKGEMGFNIPTAVQDGVVQMTDTTASLASTGIEQRAGVFYTKTGPGLRLTAKAEHVQNKNNQANNDGQEFSLLLNSWF